MIQAKCIKKFRDKQNKIYGYRLIDLNGQTQDVTPENLKSAIRNKQINVVNLTLTVDNRLVDSTEKQLQSKVLGKAPVPPVKTDSGVSDKYRDVAKALVYLDKELICMGDSYSEIVEIRAYQIGKKDLELYDLDEYYDNPEYADCDCDRDKVLDKILYKIYLKMLNEHIKEVESIIYSWEKYDSYDRFESNIQYENVDSIDKSNIFKALTLVYKYARDKKIKTADLLAFLNKVKTVGVASINMGYSVGNSYYKYLNKELFGTISNSVYTVGHSITASDIREHKEYKGYSYVFHKDINKCGAPRISIAALFKNSNDGKVQVDIKIEREGYKTSDRRCVGIVGYILNVESFIFDRSIEKEECAKIIAMKFNELVPKLYDLADVHQSLYSTLGYEKIPEKVSLDDLNSHGRIEGKKLVDLAISRWTKIRGSKTPAKVYDIDYQSDTSFRIIYDNNVTDNGNNRKLYIKYNGKEITLRVLDDKDINKVIIEESIEAIGSIVDNSPALSEVLAKALISANVRRI